MILLLWQAWQYNRGGGEGGTDGKSERPRKELDRVRDDPRFDLLIMEEEVIVATAAAFLRTRRWRN